MCWNRGYGRFQSTWRVLLLGLAQFFLRCHGAIDVHFDKLGPRLYIPAHDGYQYALEPWIHTDTPSTHTINIMMGWDNEDFEDSGMYVNVEPPFPNMAYVSITLNWEGRLKIRVRVSCAASNATFQKDFSMQIFRLKAPVYASANPLKNHFLHRYDPDEDHIRMLANSAATEYAHTDKIAFEDIVAAVSIRMPDEVERFFITVQCAQPSRTCAQGGYFLFGILRSVINSEVNLFVETANPVPAAMWAAGAPRPLAELQREGRCAGADEPSIDESLSPWARGGARISRDDVEAPLHRRTKLCWQRVRVAAGRLLIEQPELARLGVALPAHADGGDEKWYTVCLVETLLTVMQHVALPDFDVCISEELPQVFKGEGIPSLAMTRSPAHMDLVVPDFFFRYWNRSDAAVPHKWYLPAQDRSSESMAVTWPERTPRLWWRGTVASFLKGARGALVRLSARRPDIIDAKPLRVVGSAVTEEFDGAAELRAMAPSQGRGTEQDPNEPLRHRFLICTHGPHNHWSNRFRGLLSMGAVVFKQEASLSEFWEDELIPFTHYIPVSESLDDLVDKVEWAIEHDEEAEAIALAGVEFVRRRLTQERVLCYWARLLTAYAALLDYTPDTHPPNATEYANLAVMVT